MLHSGTVGLELVAVRLGCNTVDLGSLWFLVRYLEKEAAALAASPQIVAADFEKAQSLAGQRLTVHLARSTSPERERILVVGFEIVSAVEPTVAIQTLKHQLPLVD